MIGSGASGAACAAALLEAGRTVLMVDPGLTLEAERAEAVAAARTHAPLAARTAFWARDLPSGGKIPRKLLYGSDFPFREAAGRLRLRASGVGAEPSFALGGFSNIWGAAALPFAGADTDDWPVSEHEMAPHYEACAELLGIAGEEDDLAEWLPLYRKPNGQLRASRQAATMLEALTRNRDRLISAGVRYGRARLAVRTSASGGCTYCGLCLHGCPDRLIYSANDTLSALRTHPRFSYRPGLVVETVSEGGGATRAHVADLRSGARETLDANRIFLAAGALSSTGVLLRSAHAYDTPVKLRDAQYFVLPMLQLRGSPKTRDEDLHTMAQLFLELRDPDISPYTVHLQVYTYSSVLGQTVRKKLGPLLEGAARWGDAHLIAVQGYLHSKHSGAIEMTLTRDGASDRLEARGIINPDTAARIRAVTRKLATLAPLTGAWPLSPMMEVSDPGRGFHHGGSFPMREAPEDFETDTLGRPFGWNRIHVVDATVLPTIPATTITYPVMANAHRIATLACREAQ